MIYIRISQLHGNDQQVVQNAAGGIALIPPPSDVYAPRIIDQTPPQASISALDQ